jgi:hypothetical protein
MKPLTIAGIVLVALGIAGLVFQYVPIRETRTVVDAGPIQIQQETEAPDSDSGHRRRGRCDRGAWLAVGGQRRA